MGAGGAVHQQLGRIVVVAATAVIQIVQWEEVVVIRRSLVGRMWHGGHYGQGGIGHRVIKGHLRAGEDRLHGLGEGGGVDLRLLLFVEQVV